MLTESFGRVLGGIGTAVCILYSLVMCGHATYWLYEVFHTVPGLGLKFLFAFGAPFIGVALSVGGIYIEHRAKARTKQGDKQAP